MTRATKAQIEQVESEINTILKKYNWPKRVFVQWVNGYPRAYLQDNKLCVTNLSPRLSKKDMLLWLDAYKLGIGMGHNLKGAE